jgi:hypothetical protein
MAAVNPAVAGGPVGGGNMMMAADPGASAQIKASAEHGKAVLNTYIYEYFLRLGLHDVARLITQQQDKFKLNVKPKQSPGRRKDGDANGTDADTMDVDKFDIPDDLPVPQNIDMNSPGEGYLVEWFGIFMDLFAAANTRQKVNMGGPAHQYLVHAQVRC